MIRLVLLAGCLVAAPVWAQDAKKDYCTEDEAKAHIAECKKDYKGKSDTETTTFIEKLGGKKHLRIFDELKKFLSNRSIEVQEAAAKEIGKYAKETKASEALLNVVKTASAKKETYGLAQKLLFQVGEVAFRAHAKQLHGYFRHTDTNGVAQEAISSCGKLKSKDSIEPLISLMKEIEAIKEPDKNPAPPPPGGMAGAGGPTDQEKEQLKRKTLIDPIKTALQEITNEKFGTSKEWENWMHKNLSSFKEQP